jgi:hypothetical protein
LCLRIAAAKAKSNFQTKVPNLLVPTRIIRVCVHIVDKAEKRECRFWKCGLYLCDNVTCFMHVIIDIHKLTIQLKICSNYKDDLYNAPLFFGCSFKSVRLAYIRLNFAYRDGNHKE